MKEKTHKTSSNIAIALLLAGLMSAAVMNQADAESLFRAGISYQTTQSFTPHSLFAVPRPGTVGDSVTIFINESTAIGFQNNSSLSRKQDITENNTGIFNNVVKRLTGVTQLFPSVDGATNENKMDVTAKSQKQYTYKDYITCQVVQVLPNGHLLVQGRKTIFANQEQQDLMVTGIVNPYYLDSKNTIVSRQVANMQMNVVGHGMMSRQQRDGALGKYLQFFQ